MGWFPNIELEKGLKMTYEWALKNKVFEMKIKPVILSGGSGTRLWPSSRSSLPKQFICFRMMASLYKQ